MPLSLDFGVDGNVLRANLAEVALGLLLGHFAGPCGGREWRKVLVDDLDGGRAARGLGAGVHEPEFVFSVELHIEPHLCDIALFF